MNEHFEHEEYKYIRIHRSTKQLFNMRAIHVKST